MTMNVLYWEIIPAKFLYVLTKCHAIFIPRYLMNTLDRMKKIVLEAPAT